jgi:peptide/nickel transport system ATP-binding protein
MDDAPLLEVEGLTLALPGGGDRTFGVTEVSFSLRRGEILCLVGESGSGKSLCAQALMGLLPRSIRPAGGRIGFGGMDLLQLDAGTWRGLRGRRIAMVFQEPMTALNPVMRVGDQIAEMFEAHDTLGPAARRARVLELAGEVGLPDPARLLGAYPHQLSGGQRQRVMIAMALALEPDLLVADEPTTALDVTTQAQILRLIGGLQRRHGMGIVFITHDFGVVREIADSAVVLRQGRVVEQGPAARVLEAPQHPYTRALLAAVPSAEPPVRPPAEARPAACIVSHLRKTYSTRTGLLSPRRVVAAVEDVSFSIAPGEALGLVGESGCGKSTVARLMTRLLEPDGGRIEIGGEDFGAARGAALQKARRRVQMVFQDPFASLNPRRRVGHSICDGLVAAGMPRPAALERAGQLLAQVGLEPQAAARYPHAFSGGQRQRIGIARALAMEPAVLVADEAVSALDVSVQKQVLELLETLKRSLGLAMLFITHDLHVAAQLCDRIAVMQRGRIIEIGPAAEILRSPRQPYTQELLASVPGLSGAGRAGA